MKILTMSQYNFSTKEKRRNESKQRAKIYKYYVTRPAHLFFVKLLKNNKIIKLRIWEGNAALHQTKKCALCSYLIWTVFLLLGTDSCLSMLIPYCSYLKSYLSALLSHSPSNNWIDSTYSFKADERKHEYK